MKQQVLKALANPARIFYVPYSLAVMNFAVLFIIFVVVFVASLILSPKNPISPMWFLLVLIGTHMIWAVYSKREPQLAQIITAKIRLLKEKIPRRLVS